MKKNFQKMFFVEGFIRTKMNLLIKPTDSQFLNVIVYRLLNKKKTPEKLVQGPGVRKNLSVIESCTRIQFNVMSRTKARQKYIK